MENIYLYIVIILCLLAIVDLVIGVSNDAVNFLNSAIGSKAISFKVLMILASIGIILGALSSGGMMEVARKGIFNPSAFFFDDIILIFLAVMLTDIILLDFFNTLGFPTSTTVSIVFELLGAAVMMAVLKIINSEASFATLEMYINTAKATQIILGIVLSVFIAFSVGYFVQWISRLIISFNLKNKSNLTNTIFGTISLVTLFYFIVIKGLKYLDIPFLKSYMNNANFIEVIGILFIVFFLLCFVFTRILKWNIYKIIIGVGTFALALAFAGNDLVNFIGVPVAAFQSFKIWINSGVSPELLNMQTLESKVSSPTLFLFISGIIMIITLWISSKAKKVIKTSIDLSSQNDIEERFKPNIFSRVIVSFFASINTLINKIMPIKIRIFIKKQFKNNIGNKESKDSPSFDMLRASVNLVIAALLITIATSLKLPLSTTYVTFMVAMGTSLADRAWNRDTAVYRVSGVTNVVVGWFFTAISAFIIAGIYLLILKKLGIAGIILALVFTIYIILRNHLRHKRELKKTLENFSLVKLQSKSLQGIIKGSSSNALNFSVRINEIYLNLIKGVSLHKKKRLKDYFKQIKKLEFEISELQQNVFPLIKNTEKYSLEINKFYIALYTGFEKMLQKTDFILKECFDHVNNNYMKLRFIQIKKLEILFEKNQLLFEQEKAFYENTNLKNINVLEKEVQNVINFIEELLSKEINTIKKDNKTSKNTKLYFKILINFQEIVNLKREIIKEFKSIQKL